VTSDKPATLEQDKHTYHTLDGIRGVAAVAVAWLHAKAFFPIFPESGHLAVDLFFMLSGFVLYHS
jgi:peptidoglycan/LPS O-acetylase OafA/YrhL